MFPHNDMARLFPAQIQAVLPHGLHHMPVPHGGAVKFQIQGGEEMLQPHIAHHCGCHPVAPQQALFIPIPRNNGQNGIAVNQCSVFITQNQTVRITIQGNAQIGFLGNHAGTQLLWMQTAALGIDVKPIGGNP